MNKITLEEFNQVCKEFDFTIEKDFAIYNVRIEDQPSTRKNIYMHCGISFDRFQETVVPFTVGVCEDTNDNYKYYSWSTTLIYWNNGKPTRPSWPDKTKYNSLKEYLESFIEYAHKLKKNHQIHLKKSVIKDKIFDIEEEATVGLFNEFIENHKELNLKLDFTSDLKKFGDFNFKHRPKLKCWDITIPYNRDYFWRVSSFGEVYKICEWWYSKPDTKIMWGKVK